MYQVSRQCCMPGCLNACSSLSPALLGLLGCKNVTTGHRPDTYACFSPGQICHGLRCLSHHKAGDICEAAQNLWCCVAVAGQAYEAPSSMASKLHPLSLPPSGTSMQPSIQRDGTKGYTVWLTASPCHDVPWVKNGVSILSKRTGGWLHLT